MTSTEPKCLAAIKIDAPQRHRITFESVGLLWALFKTDSCIPEVWRVLRSANKGTSSGYTVWASSLNMGKLEQWLLCMPTGHFEVYWCPCNSRGSTEEEPTSCPVTGKWQSHMCLGLLIFCCAIVCNVLASIVLRTVLESAAKGIAVWLNCIGSLEVPYVLHWVFWGPNLWPVLWLVHHRSHWLALSV